MGQVVMVGMSEIRVVCGEGYILTTLGLGSCIGICAYDAAARVSGMAHVMLPEGTNGVGEDMPGKFANTAIPALVQEMRQQGALLSQIQVAIAGGAQIFSFGGSSPRLDIGSRNIAAVLATLKLHQLPLVAADVGGNVGRTLYFFTVDGRVRVKTLGQGERDLVILGQSPPVRMSVAV
jgi:chemotaxis protein CheD